MVAVTERAKDALLEKKLAANIWEPDVGLRVEPDPRGQWMLIADRARADDRVVEHNGATVLLIGADMREALAGTKVDCRPAPGGDVEFIVTPTGIDNGQP